MKNAFVILLMVCSCTFQLKSQNFWSESGNFSSSSDKFGTLNNTSLNFYTYDQSRMTLTSSGLLGLGTSSPISKFHLHDEQIYSFGSP